MECKGFSDGSSALERTASAPTGWQWSAAVHDLHIRMVKLDGFLYSCYSQWYTEMDWLCRI